MLMLLLIGGTGLLSLLNQSTNGQQLAAGPLGPAILTNNKMPITSYAEPRRVALANGGVQVFASKSDVSPPLRSIKPIGPTNRGVPAAVENDSLPQLPSDGAIKDPAVQKSFGPLVMPTAIQNFEGILNYAGVLPPDTNGEVGPNHYVEMVNSLFQVYNKTGTSVYGPADINTLFSGFGGLCEARNDGDPIVLYDQLSDRWLLTQFISAAPFGQCIAISTGPDPAGSYFRYYFPPGTPNSFGDYEKLSVWPNAFFMTTNEFANGTAFAGTGAYAFDRIKLLTGDSTASAVYNRIPGQGGSLPVDLEGFNLPPAGSPGFIFLPTNGNSGGNGIISEYKFSVNFSLNPPVSTFTGPFPITVAPYNTTICSATRGACIDQPAGAPRVEAVSDRFMFRATYRNFGDHESVLINHTVNATSPANPGIGRCSLVRVPSS